jgi:hypothetical protein
MARLILIIFISLFANASENTGALSQTIKSGEYMKIKNITGRRANCFIGQFSFVLNDGEWSQPKPKSIYWGCK